jgi:hypothetical protein
MLGSERKEVAIMSDVDHRFETHSEFEVAKNPDGVPPFVIYIVVLVVAVFSLPSLLRRQGPR